MNPKTIWNEKQNKPSLVVADLAHIAHGIEDVVYESLLRRGVFKWLSVRYHLIRLKNVWKDNITQCLSAIVEHKKVWPHIVTCSWSFRLGYLRGYHAAMVECREDVRRLCHSDRWQAPPNDRKAVEWLEQRTEVCEVAEWTRERLFKEADSDD